MVELEEDKILTLLESLKNEDLHIKIYTMERIAENSNNEKAILPLVSYLSHKNQTLRAKACWTLGKIGDELALDPLVISLNDPVPKVRTQAIRAIGQIGSQRSIENIIPLLYDENSEVRNEAALILDYLGWKPSTLKEQTLFLIAKEQWEKVIQLTNEDITLQLLPYLYDKDEEVVIGIIYVLGELKSKKAIQPLFDLFMKTNIKEVQKNASQALAKIGGEKALELLLVALHDSDWYIRKCASESLGDIGNLLALNPLLDLQKDENPYVKKSVAKALEKLRKRKRKKEQKEERENET